MRRPVMASEIARLEEKCKVGKGVAAGAHAGRNTDGVYFREERGYNQQQMMSGCHESDF